MNAKFKSYEKADFMRIRDFLVKHFNVFDVPVNWMIDRLNFTSTVSKVFNNTSDVVYESRIGIWEEEGEIISLVLMEGENKGEAFFQFSKQVIEEELVEAMFDFAETNLIEVGDDLSGYLNLRIPEEYQLVKEIAIKRGFTQADWCESISKMDKKAVITCQLPENIDLKKGNEVSTKAKAYAHANAFGYKLSPYDVVKPLAFKLIEETPDYNQELNYYAVNDEGEVVSFAGVWIDSVNKIAILEPVGTHKDYRKKGLAKALIMQGFADAIKLGVNALYVGSDQPFYLAIGFERITQWPVWTKKW